MAAVASTTISEARTAFRLLNGIFCLYKPYGWERLRIIKEFRHKICEDLNQMRQIPRQEIVQIRRMDDSEKMSRIALQNEKVLSRFDDGRKHIEVVQGLSYQDHPLVTGARFEPKDLTVFPANKINTNVTGVHLFGINKGRRDAERIFHSRWLRTYLVSGKFGIATSTGFHTGRVVEKATYHTIHRAMFERLLASTQSAHQRLSYLATGVPLESERAYELASQGLVRPAEKSAPVIYSIKCVDFKLPDFTLEIKAINEDSGYIQKLVHELGLKLHSVATCTKLQITNVGPFGINDALLFKHWNVENVINNLNNSKQVLSNFNLEVRDMWVDKPFSFESEFDTDYTDTESTISDEKLN
ncbi:unnamed protein product [Orchesella dallaii]|uniref:Pseudouridine synthase II N-terminal domain-containing protein n=1 Tax=Orchesella dallaii TaxID=48710 RepID=A0ABP1S576_9HEXA